MNAQTGNASLEWSSEIQPIPTNRIHAWKLTLENDEGHPLSGCLLVVDGGMPKHDHGLPTRPAINETGVQGEYRLHGLRFHMPGAWELKIKADCPEGYFGHVRPLWQRVENILPEEEIVAFVHHSLPFSALSAMSLL